MGGREGERESEPRTKRASPSEKNRRAFPLWCVPGCTTPSLLPFSVISIPRVLIRDNEIPTPPPDAVSFISSALVNPIPRIESGVSTPKHEIGKPLSVPMLDRTGDANPNQPFHIILKNLLANSGFFNLKGSSFNWI